MKKDDIRLFAARVDFLSETSCFGQAVKFVSNARNEKAARLRRQEDKNLSLGAELLLRYALKTVGESGEAPDFSYGENGKPYLQNKRIYFNLSHSGQTVLCGVSGSELGCDIEKVGPADLKIAKRFFSAAEWETLSCLEPKEQTEEFYRIWTGKESYLKALGCGLRFPLSAFTVLPGAEPFSAVMPDGERWYFKTFSSVEGYACSLCSRADCGKTQLETADLKTYLQGVTE